MASRWKESAKLVEKVFDGYVDWYEGFFICPECGEPVFEVDWEDDELEDFICPVCEWEGD
jgi:rubrerythrin